MKQTRKVALNVYPFFFLVALLSRENKRKKEKEKKQTKKQAGKQFKKRLAGEENTKESKTSLSDLSKDLVRIRNTFTQVKRLLCQAILTAFDWGVWTHYIIGCFCRSLQSKHESQVTQILTTQQTRTKKLLTKTFTMHH